MFGVEGHGHIEDLGLEIAGLLAGEGPEEVGGVAEVVTRGDDVETLALAVEGRHDGGHAGGETGSGALQLLLREVAGQGIEGAKGGDADFQAAHGLGGAGELANEDAVEVGKRALSDEERLEVLKLLVGGKLEVPEKERGLFEGSMLGQIVDVVAGVDELALLAINGAELGGGDVDAFKATLDFGSHGESSLSWRAAECGRAPDG